MRTTGTSTSPSPQCLPHNRANSAAPRPPCPLYAQVHWCSISIDELLLSSSYKTNTFLCSHVCRWRVSAARLRSERSLSSGLSVPDVPAGAAAEEGPGDSAQHQLLSGGLRHLPLLRYTASVCQRQCVSVCWWPHECVCLLSLSTTCFRKSDCLDSSFNLNE